MLLAVVDRRRFEPGVCHELDGLELEHPSARHKKSGRIREDDFVRRDALELEVLKLREEGLEATDDEAKAMDWPQQKPTCAKRFSRLVAPAPSWSAASWLKRCRKNWYVTSLPESSRSTSRGIAFRSLSAPSTHFPLSSVSLNASTRGAMRSTAWSALAPAPNFWRRGRDASACPCTPAA